MASEIKCKVSRCDYWKNMRCGANRIEVNMQKDESDTCSSDSTFCETFKTKEC